MKKFFSVLVLTVILGFGSAAQAESIGSKLLLWPANRVMDALDIFSVSLGIGPTVRAELMATEYCKVGGGIGYLGGIVKNYNRQYGISARNGFYWSLITVQQENMEQLGGIGTIMPYQQKIIGVPDPITDPLYDFYEGSRDFWRIGGALGLLVEGELYIHPVEIADFITGIFFIDLRADDYTIEDFQR